TEPTCIECCGAMAFGEWHPLVWRTGFTGATSTPPVGAPSEGGLMLKSSLVSLSLILAVPALAVAQEKKAAPSSNSVINVFPNCLQVPGNLIQNCGFESGTFDGWTQSADTSFTSVTTDAAHSGNFGAKIGPEGFAGFLTQVVPTTAGQRYDLSFWLRNAGQPN